METVEQLVARLEAKGYKIEELSEEGSNRGLVLKTADDEIRFYAYQDFMCDGTIFRSVRDGVPLKFYVDRSDMERHGSVMFSIVTAAANQLPDCSLKHVNAIQSALIAITERNAREAETPDWGLF